MEDPVLNRSLEETRELHTRWGQFRDFVLMAIKSRKVSAQAEMKFLELKSRIAMLHDGFMQRLQHEQKTGQNIMAIVGDCILLKRCAAYNDAEKQKFEFDWNECYLLLTEQMGALEEEQRRLAAINERAYNLARRREAMTAQVHNFLRSTGFKFVMGVLALIFVGWGVPALDIYQYTELGKMSWSQPFYRPFVNFFWRPVINSELPYMTFEEIRRNDNVNLPGSISVESNRDVTPEYFRETELAGRAGFRLRGPALERARQALPPDARFETERFTAQNEDSRFYYIYFDSVDQAIAFTDSLREAVQEMSTEDKSAVRGQVFLQRRANFVVIGVSKHVHRAFPRQRYYFPDEMPNLLDT